MGAILRVWLGRCLIALILLSSSAAARAHEVRPAFLSLTETAPAEFAMLWKQPVTDGKRLKITPNFPEGCAISPPQMQIQGSTVIESNTLSCPLTSGIITLPGLERTLTDVFVQIQYLSGEARSALIKPNSPQLSLDSPPQNAAGQYLRIGVDHILFGWDHLLFVIGLTLLVARRQIWGVATAFTLAHSITLALAAFGFLSLPSRPVEILIAASIVLLGIEIIRKQRGHDSLASRRPYLISFIIGLIHGCGFASALAAIGLPQGTELLALLLFNIGVELGQFAVIGLTVLVLWGIERSDRSAKQYLRRAELILTYSIASIAMFWVIDRMSQYWA